MLDAFISPSIVVIIVYRSTIDVTSQISTTFVTFEAVTMTDDTSIDNNAIGEKRVLVAKMTTHHNDIIIQWHIVEYEF
jgi:hypothetical protein